MGFYKFVCLPCTIIWIVDNNEWVSYKRRYFLQVCGLMLIFLKIEEPNTKHEINTHEKVLN